VIPNVSCLLSFIRLHWWGILGSDKIARGSVQVNQNVVVATAAVETNDGSLSDRDSVEIADSCIEGNAAFKHSRVLSGFGNELLVCHGSDVV
jgi:hypothetical protein